MGLFGRKTKGRHALGAAVTSIPSGPQTVAVAAPVFEAAVAPAAPTYEAPVLARQAVPATTAEAVSQLLLTGEWAASPEAPLDSAPGFAVPLARSAVPEQHLPPMNLQPLPMPAPSAVAPPSPVVALLAAVAPVAPPPLTTAAAPAPPVANASPSPAPVLSVASPALPAPVVPSAVPAVSPVPRPVPAPGPGPQGAAAAPPAPARSSLEAALAELLPSQEDAAAETPEPTAPSRVQLGFRDGTSAPLDPRSSQFAELEALAQSLTQRD